MADDTNDDTSHRYLVFDPAKTVTTLARLLRLTGERFETIYDAGACGHNEEFICVGRVEAIGARTPDVALFDMTWRCFHCGASDALYGQALHDA